MGVVNVKVFLMAKRRDVPDDVVTTEGRGEHLLEAVREAISALHSNDYSRIEIDVEHADGPPCPDCNGRGYVVGFFDANSTEQSSRPCRCRRVW